MDPNNFVIFAGVLVEDPRPVAPDAIRMRVERPGKGGPTRVLVQAARIDPQVRGRLMLGTEVQVVGALELCVWKDAAGSNKEMLRLAADQIIVLGGNQQEPQRLTFSGLESTDQT